MPLHNGTVFCLSAKKPLHTGVRAGCYYLIGLSVCVCVPVSLCVTFVVFTDCESCTRPISTNPVSIQAGEYGQTRGTWFFARRLKVVAVAGLLWISWCVLGGAIFFLVFFFRFFFSSNAIQPAASMRPPCLICPSTSTGVRTGCHYLISLCVCVCDIRRF